MSKFKVGDRARLINCDKASAHGWANCNGDEVTILGLPGSIPEFPTSYGLTRPAHYDGNARRYSAPPEFLSPILPDSAADEFIARIKKLGREPIVPLVPVKEAP